jgi:hypothetical protein
MPELQLQPPRTGKIIKTGTAKTTSFPLQWKTPHPPLHPPLHPSSSSRDSDDDDATLAALTATVTALVGAAQVVVS